MRESLSSTQYALISKGHVCWGLKRQTTIRPRLIARSNRRLVNAGTAALALGELESSPGSLSSIFLSFFNSRVSSQEPLPAQRCAHVCPGLKQSHTNPVTYCPSLAYNATALTFGDHIVASDSIYRLERLVDEHLEDLSTHILLHWHTVDGNGACARRQPHLGGRIFPMTRSVVSRGVFQYNPPASGVGRSASFTTRSTTSQP